MSARTSSAQAFNSGTFGQAREDGFDYLEVTDGFGCGWSNHQDADKAMGTVRHIDDCMAHSLSHPRCARGFSARPDVASKSAAKAAASVFARRTGADGGRRGGARGDPSRHRSARRPLRRRAVVAEGGPVGRVLHASHGQPVRRLREWSGPTSDVNPDPARPTGRSS